MRIDRVNIIRTTCAGCLIFFNTIKYNSSAFNVHN